MVADKIDFKKTLKHLYRPSAKDFVLMDVPQMQYLKVDGKGAPGGEDYSVASEWLYATSYPIKFISKIEHDRDYVVPLVHRLLYEFLPAHGLT